MNLFAAGPGKPYLGSSVDALYLPSPDVCSQSAAAADWLGPAAAPDCSWFFWFGLVQALCFE